MNNPEFTREDLYHLDELIAEEMANRPGLVAMPGIEHLRNKIARAVDLPEAPEGGVTWALIRETDYGMDPTEIPVV